MFPFQYQLLPVKETRGAQHSPPSTHKQLYAAVLARVTAQGLVQDNGGRTGVQRDGKKHRLMGDFNPLKSNKNTGSSTGQISRASNLLGFSQEGGRWWRWWRQQPPICHTETGLQLHHTSLAERPHVPESVLSILYTVILLHNQREEEPSLPPFPK